MAAELYHQPFFVPMKLKAIFFIFLLMGCMQVFAQTAKLRVLIIDDKKDTIQNATAVLYSLPDTALVTKKIMLAEIFFNIKTKTNYVLKITAAGLQDKWLPVIINADTLIKAEMRYKINNLGNVTVVSKKPLIKQEDDKTIIDAEVLANSSTNAYEILEKTPGTIVDQDGNVYLSSTTPATILINGREMKLSSADIASLLKNLPAGSVSKIEILRTPSAKYDASSSGGMVNIVLKKGIKLGTNGTFNIAHFQGVYGTKTAGFSLNKGSGKINSYISYQFTGKNSFEELNSDRFIKFDTTLLAQKSFTTYPTTSNYLNGGIDIQFTPRFNAGYDMRMSYTKSKSFASNNIVISKEPLSAFIGQNTSDIINANKTTFLGSTLSAKYKIDTTGSEWTAVFDYNYYGNTNTQLYKNFNYAPPVPTVSGDGANKNHKHVFLFQTDLILKLQESLTLETGFKITISNSENSANYFKDTGNNIRFVDGFQTNTFRYKENITAAYLQVSKTFAGFTIKPGLRLELTDINGKQLIPKDTTLYLNRTDFFPYLFIRHKLFKMFGFPLIGNAIYRKSIRRPYYEVLNPYPRYVDQYLYDVGNPKLKPQFTTNYEVNVTFNNIPVIALGINNTKDIFSSVTYQDSNKIAYRTYDNLGKNKETYAKVIGGIPPGGRYFFYAGVQFNHNIYNGFYEGRPLNYKRSSWTFFMFQELKVTPAFSINMQGFLRTKGLQNLYELNTFGGLFVSANKSILKKKANIILSVSDLLQTNRVSFSLQQGSVSAQGQRINDTRRLGLTFRYNFGVKPKEENKKTFDAPSDIN